MQVSRLVKFLEKNINAEDRKLLNKLNKHIAAKYVRELNLLVSSYNIDRKKVSFLEEERLNEQYIYSVNQLLLFCKRIIENKIDISKFNPKQFSAGKTIDLSSNTRVDLLIRHLRHYTKKYPDITFPEDIVNNPLSVLTIPLKRRIEIGLVDKAGRKNINKVPRSHAAPAPRVQTRTVGGTRSQGYGNTQTTGYALREDNSNLGDGGLYLQEDKGFNNDFITDDENLSSIMLENPLDAITESGIPDEYISGDVADRVARERAYRRDKESKSTITIIYNLLDFVSPISVLFLTIIAFIIGLVTTNFELMYLFSFLTIFNVCLFLYRLGLVTAKEESFAAGYYQHNFDKFKIFGVVVLIAVLLQIFYYLNFSQSFSNNIELFGDYLLANRETVKIGVLVFLGIDLLLLISAALFFKTHRYVIFISQAVTFYIFMLIVLLCAKVTDVTSMWRPFYVLKDHLIYFVAITSGMLLYCIFNNKKTRLFSSIAIAVVVLTYFALSL